MIQTKHLTSGATLKTLGEEGSLEAVFVTFDPHVDLDGDVTAPDALTNGQEVPMVYAHDWSKPPIGKGRVRLEPTRAVFAGQFFLDTQAGRDAWQTTKLMGSLQEYSWGFRVLDSDYVQRQGKEVRRIKKADLFEVSPVLVGAAGRGATGTLTIKQAALALDPGLLVRVFRDVTTLAAVLQARHNVKDGRQLSAQNRTRLETLRTALALTLADLDTLLADTAPAKAGAAAALRRTAAQLQATIAALPTR